MSTLENSLAEGGLRSLLVKKNGAPQTINLAEKFGSGYTFEVQTSNGDVVKSAVDANGLLTLDFGALGHSDIHIVGTAANGATVGDYFRVRVAGENAYTIAVMPDTQDYSANYASPEIFTRMTKWLVENKESLGIQFVTHVGDVTYHNTDVEWQRAETSMRVLDGKIPYSLLPGNHDIASGGTASSRTLDNLSKYFTVEEQSKLPGFGGVYDKEPESYQNNFHTFTAPDGTKWLNLSLEFGARDDVLRWAGEVIEGHLDYRVIITTHGYMAGDERVGPMTPQLTGENAGPAYGVGNDVRGSSDGDQMWQQLVSKYPNIAFTFSGHNFIDGAQTQINYGAGGQPVLQVLVNYQNGVARETTGNGTESQGQNGGNGAIRLVTIDPDNDTVHTETYFTELDDYMDGYRVKPELDRDGLTGSYLGHQETFTGIDLSAPSVMSVAKAGKDMTIKVAGTDAASVTLDASASIIPAGTSASYAWKDADGKIVATGPTAVVEQQAGTRVLTLEVTDAKGHISRDQIRVTVADDNTLLTDNFNDGDYTGWSAPSTVKLAEFGSATSFKLPTLDGTDSGVLKFPQFTKAQHIALKPELATVPENGLITSYTFVMDVNLPGTADWWSMFQTDTANGNDADFYLRKDSATQGSLGISQNYQGVFTFNAWQRIAVSYEKQVDPTGVNPPTYLIKKYIDGELVGQQVDTYREGRFDIDAKKGVLLFTDGSAATMAGSVNSVLFADHALTADEIKGFGKADADGIASQPIAGASQFDFNSGTFASTFGPGKMSVSETTTTSPLVVVGTVKSGEADGEGTLKDLTGRNTNILVWNNAAAKAWGDYVYDISISTNDNSGQIGVVFHYQDQQNHYRMTFDVNGNARSLVKVQGGVETVLATVAKGITMGTELDLKVSVADGQIRVLLDGKDVFGGPVTDAAPLGKGTVGVITGTQDTATFDNVSVNKIALTAHGESEGRVVDADGDGQVAVSVSAGGSFGPDDITEYRWILDDKTIATGKDAILTLAAATKDIVLEVRDAAAQVSRDVVKVNIVEKNTLKLNDGFDAQNAAWTFVNEGENAVVANWHVAGGKLVQDADVSSRQLTSGGNASSTNLWDRGWSPLGDGDYILRKGTYARYDAEGASAWKNYAVEATFNGGGDDAVGLMFYYQDADNYYKLELDRETKLFQMTKLVDGVETILSRTGGQFAKGTDVDLRIDIKDNVIFATIDGEAIFANPVEDHSLTHGTVALYNWGAAGGVSYDDVRVVSLGSDTPDPVDPVDPVDPPVFPGPDQGQGPGGEIIATPGGGRLQGTTGNDVFQGNSGIDTVVQSAAREAYKITLGTDGKPTSITGPDGTDTLTGIERLEFSNGTLAFDVNATAGQSYRLYQAAFNRDPDAEGLGFWIRLQDGKKGDLGFVADNFIQSQEFARIYGTEKTVTNTAFVSLLYTNALGRAADPDGLSYWAGRLNSGDADRKYLLSFFSESTENRANTAAEMSDGIWYA